MTSIELRLATPALLERFYGQTPKRTSRAIVAVEGERVLGVAGVYQDGARMVAFTEMSDEIRANKRLIVRGYRMLKPLLEAGLPIYALADRCVEGSEVLLRHFGFERVCDEVYQWQG